jgi:hypothetical protein
MNVSADSATLTKKGLIVSGYLVTAAQVVEAIVHKAEVYADQTERDHAALLTAIKQGRIQAMLDV